MAKYRNQYIFAPDSKKRRPKGGCLLRFLFIVAIAAVCVFVINLTINTQCRLDTQHLTLPRLPSDLEGFTILHISDLAGQDIGNRQSGIVQAIGTKNYKAVCLTGDMVGKDGDYQPLLALISQLKQNVPVYLIAGNSDPDPLSGSSDGLRLFADYISAVRDAGVIYVDAPVAQTVKKSTIWFCPESQYSLDVAAAAQTYQNQLDTLTLQGASATPEGQLRLQAATYEMDVMTRLQEAQKAMQDKDIQIMLSHYPVTSDYVNLLLQDASGETAMQVKNVTLILSGHYCAGGWRLPLIGAIYTPELGFFPDNSLLAGMQSLRLIPQYISPGVGSDGESPLPGRLFNSPTVTLIKLSSALE